MRSRQACTPVHRPRSVVSFLVSFSYVRPGSPGNSRPYHRRSQTAATHSEHGPTDLERVWLRTSAELSDSGSRTGAAASAQLRRNAVIVAA